MFWLPAVAAALGALVMGTTKPRTSFTKTRSLGSRSGTAYEVEDFQGAGFLVVRAPDGSEGVLIRKLSPHGIHAGFEWSRGRGNVATLEVIKSDFGVAAPQVNGK